jgi:hypothetical protein
MTSIRMLRDNLPHRDYMDKDSDKTVGWSLDESSGMSISFHQLFSSGRMACCRADNTQNSTACTYSSHNSHINEAVTEVMVLPFVLGSHTFNAGGKREVSVYRDFYHKVK